jgi:D-alanyl-D-alanine carboxypeptidase
MQKGAGEARTLLLYHVITMQRTLGYLISLILAGLALFWCLCVFRDEMPSPLEIKSAQTAALPNISLTGPILSAKAYLVFNLTTNEVLVSHGEKNILPIASVTKLFTAASVLQNLNIDATTTVTQSDIDTEGDSGRLKIDEIYSVHELLFPLLLASSNDSAEALERYSGHILTKDLNAWALDTGANDTIFYDTSGLSSANVSTALDLQKLLARVYFTSPHILDISRLPQYVGKDNGWRNNNPVFMNTGYRGGKHGYTTAAGKTLVAVFTEEVIGVQGTYGYILLNSDNLSSDLETLRTFITGSSSRQ